MNIIIQWLIAGDPAIVFQTNRDLLNTNNKNLINLRENITKNG